METLTSTTIDKSKWPRGPWDLEVDKKQWTDAATGLPCLIVRHSRCGHWCGYVGVPEGHPLFGKTKEDDALDGLRAHGGITFTDLCQPLDKNGHGICHVPGPGEPDRAWWIGFDCGHAWDLSPAYQAGVVDDADYRDQAYVEAECAILAAQLQAKERR